MSTLQVREWKCRLCEAYEYSKYILKKRIYVVGSGRYYMIKEKKHILTLQYTYSETEEPFLAIPLPVKNKKNVKESL